MREGWLGPSVLYPRIIENLVCKFAMFYCPLHTVKFAKSIDHQVQTQWPRKVDTYLMSGPFGKGVWSR